MVSLRTDLGNLKESARRKRVELSGSITATDVQHALQDLDTGKLTANVTTLAVGNLTVSTSFVSLGSNVLSSLVVSSTAVVFGNAAVASLTVSAAGIVFGGFTVSSLTVTNGATVLGSAAVSSLTVSNGALLAVASGSVGIGTTNPQSLFNVNKNTTTAGAIAGTAIQVTGGNATNSIIQNDAFGVSGTIYPGFVTRAARGSATTPSAVQATDLIFNATGRGFDTTFQNINDVALVGSAAENFTATSHGTYLDVYTTPTGSVTITQVARFQGSGGLSIGTTTDPGTGGILAIGSSTLSALNVTNAARLGSLTVTTTATVLGQATVSGLTVTNTAAVGSLSVTNNATMLGVATVSSLNVTNAATIFGNATVSALTVTNAGRLGSLVVTTTGSVLGILAVSSLSVTATATVFGNTTLTSLIVSNTITAAGGQVSFPATQNASTDVNTLDDYEEGTWTPVVTFETLGNLAATYSQQVGTYVKIGKLVTVDMQILTSTFTHTTANGNLQITGLPFASENTANAQYRGSTIFSGITKTSYTAFILTIAPNTAVMTMQASGSGVAASNVNTADMPSGGQVILSTTIAYKATA